MAHTIDIQSNTHLVFIQNAGTQLVMGDNKRLSDELASLSQEHQELNTRIAEISREAVANQILMQRLKRRKLQIKDRVALLRSMMCDDIIA